MRISPQMLADVLAAPRHSFADTIRTCRII
jgi:hypothetical protein